MVLVLSSHSNDSQHVKREVQNAFREEPQIPVLPFLVEDIKLNKSLRYYIGSVHWLRALTPALEDHLHQLVDFVQQRWLRADDETAERPEAEDTKKPDRILAKREEAAKLAEVEKRKEARRQREKDEQQEKLVDEAAKLRAEEEQRALAEKELKEQERREAAQTAARQAEEERTAQFRKNVPPTDSVTTKSEYHLRQNASYLSFDDKPLGHTQLLISAEDMLITALRQYDPRIRDAAVPRGDKALFDLDSIFKIATDIIFRSTPADRVVALLSDSIVTEQNADEAKLFPIATRARDERMEAHARKVTIGRTVAAQGN